MIRVEMTGFQFALPLLDDQVEIKINPTVLPSIDFIIQNNELRILFAQKATLLVKMKFYLKCWKDKSMNPGPPFCQSMVWQRYLAPKALKWQMFSDNVQPNCGLEFKFTGNSLYLDSFEDIQGRVEIKVYDLTGRMLSSQILDGLDRGNCHRNFRPAFCSLTFYYL
ncbi:MAG: hypothetical protein IPH36_19075 [Saprospiraceae bacterium]|nr:hypothetical protein [Saprospiraceae bacterium]